MAEPYLWKLPHAVQVVTGYASRSKAPNSKSVILGLRVGFRLWILPPLSNSWVIIKIWIYTALNRTTNIDCYCVGAVPNLGSRNVHSALQILR